MTPARRDVVWLGVAATLGLAVPSALARIVDSRLRGRVEPALSEFLGEEVRIAEVEATLDGSVRLSGVRVGGLFAADGVSASVGLSTLLAGRFAADELEVERPRVTAAVREDGSLDAAEPFERVRARRAQGRVGVGVGVGSGRRIRKIVVTGGELVVTLAGRGEIRAAGVELHPQEDGVRVVAGALAVDVAVGKGDARLTGRFARGGFDVALPRMRVGRAALAGGELTLAAGGAKVTITDAALTRGVDREAGRLVGRLAGPGTPFDARLLRSGGAVELALEATELPIGAIAAALPGWPRALDARTAVMSGRVTVGREAAAGELFADGRLTVAGLAVDHRLLAAEPLPVAGDFTFEGSWSAPERAGRVRVDARAGELLASAELEVALDAAGAPARARLAADVPRVGCAGALAAVPAPLRRRLEGLVLGGTIAGRVDVEFDRRTPDAARLDVELDVGCQVHGDAPAADPAALRAAYVHPLPGGGERIMREGAPGFVPLDDLPGHVVGAFLAGEDARFYQHHGFDEEQLRRSFQIDVAVGRVERGGSTITQQLVKNLWLGRERTIGRKLVEAVLTWRVEQVVAKERQLEVYLNLIELGHGVYGVEPAAHRWFGKPARKLTVAEAAFLAALTPAPLSTDRKIRETGQVDPDMDRRWKAVLRSMLVNHVIDRGRYARALREPIPLIARPEQARR